MSSHEFSEWIAYHHLDPFGEERADFRNAIIACTIANIHGRKKGQRPFKPEDFMPQYGASLAGRRQDPKVMEAILRGYAIAHNRARKNKEQRIGATAHDKLRSRNGMRKE